MFTPNTTAPVSAIRQALRYAYGCTFRQLAGLTGGVHLKTATQSVYAKPGSNVAPWSCRTEAQRGAAIVAAGLLLAGN